MAFVQVRVGGGTGTSTRSLAYTSNVASGATLIVLARCSDAQTINSCSDDVNGAWTAIHATVTTGVRRYRVFYFANSASGTVTVSVVYDADPTTTARLLIAEYSGHAASPLDLNSTGFGLSTSADSGTTGTLAQADEEIIGFAGFLTGVITPGGTYTERSDSGSVNLADKIVAATTGVNYTATGDNTDWFAGVYTFKLSVAGGGPRIVYLVDGPALNSLINAGLAA